MFFVNLLATVRDCTVQHVPLLAHAVVKATKSCHVTPVLRSLHWRSVTELIDYKLLSVSYKVLLSTQSTYLHNLISVQPPRSTRSSPLVTFTRPSTLSLLRITVVQWSLQ